ATNTSTLSLHDALPISRQRRNPDMAQTQADPRDPNVYFVPHDSKWPVFASVALFILFFGLASWFNEVSWGRPMFFVGCAGLILRSEEHTSELQSRENLV